MFRWMGGRDEMLSDAQLGLGLLERHLIGAGVDLCQQIAPVDYLAFLKSDPDQRSLDLAADDNRVPGIDRADAVQIDRHVARLDRRRDDGHGWGRPNW